MDYLSKPTTALSGELLIPGDKSLSHRALIFASLAEGITPISGLLPSEDVLATLSALRQLGVRIDYNPGDTHALVHGNGLAGLVAPTAPLDLGNSGTAIRLITGLLAWQPFDSVLTGDESLLTRPMSRIADPLRTMGAAIALSASGTAPITVSAASTPLSGIDYTMPVASAQIKSALLLAGLGASSPVTVRDPGVSRDHTEIMMRYLGIPVVTDAGAVLLSTIDRFDAKPIDVVGDISSAAFFLVAASIIPGSDLVLRRVGVNPTRTGIIDLLRRMGANIQVLKQTLSNGGEAVADLRVCYAPLKGITITAHDVPTAIDELPVLMVAAACAQGQTVVSGAQELRVKESDRIGATVGALRALGITALETRDGMIVEGGTVRSGTIVTHGDHRIAMAFAVAGAVADGPVQIRDTDNVATSYPDFITAATAVGLCVEKESNNNE